MDIRDCRATDTKRIVVGVSGATGTVYAVRALELLRQLGIETHLVVTGPAALTLKLETKYSLKNLKELASNVHPIGDIGASIASGSFRTDGMLVIPCSMKTLSAIVHSYSDNLLTRAADVTLKERRPLVLVTRETPLHLGHVRLMEQAIQMGAVIFPPVPAWYSAPHTIEDIVTQTACRALELLRIETSELIRWIGTSDKFRDQMPTSKRN